MKKLISLFMAVVMLFGIGAEAFAAYEGDKAHTYESADCTIVYTITNEWTGNQLKLSFRQFLRELFRFQNHE